MSARTMATSPAEARGKNTERSRVARITPRASILGFVVFVAAIFAVAPARAYLDQRAQRDQLANQVSELEQQNADLQQQLDRLQDPAELDRLARSASAWSTRARSRSCRCRADARRPRRPATRPTVR